MSRFHRALHGVASGYILLAATAVYSLASVPVALHYLTKEQFGLWVVMGTLVNYLNLIDVGMTGAVARLLIDHKDDRNGGQYGSLILTGWLVSTLQGLLVFGVGLGFAGVFATLLKIDSDLMPEFTRLVVWQCGALALSFAGRMLNLVLNAHQRMDISNYIGAGSLLVNFVAQWIFFHLGSGILSLAFGGFASFFFGFTLQAAACSRWRLLPDAGHWGRVTQKHFMELFNYGKDVFLVSVGTQLILASQPLIITRMLGAEAAAVWGVGLRAYNLLNQVVWKVYDMSQAAFAEMLARGELKRLQERYQTICMASFAVTGWAAISFGVCNHLFVTVWTHGKIQWPALNDWLLAVWMLLSVIVHCHNSFVLMTKQVRSMPYVYFAEGVTFVGLAGLTITAGGLAAVIGGSLVCTTAFSLAYGLRRIKNFLHIPLGELALGWLQPTGKLALLYLPIAALIAWLVADLPVLVQLAIHSLLTSGIGFLLLLRFGLPPTLQNELLGRIPAKYTSTMKRLFAKT